MRRNPQESPLPAEKFEQSITKTVELTEIDGIEAGAILKYTNIGSFKEPTQEKEVQTCYGDLCVVINVLRDYSSLLKSVITEWGLSGYHAAKFEDHSARCRKIADKYAAAIGYNYDKAMERCEKRRGSSKADDTGMDGIEALIRKREMDSNKKKKGGCGKG